MRDHEFFKDTSMTTLDMDGQPIEFPALYYDFRFVNCIFFAKIDRLKKILPHPLFDPIRVWPGTGLLGIAAFEYRDTSLGPYNEVAVSVPINYAPAKSPGTLSALSMLRRKIFPVYIHQLPVTTEIARVRGVYFYNYPKFVAGIDFQERQDSIEVTLKEGDELILKMTARKYPAKSAGFLEFHTFSLMDGKVKHALVEGMATNFGMKKLGRCGDLELGVHRISDELRGLGLSKAAWSGFYGEGAMSKLHAPD